MLFKWIVDNELTGNSLRLAAIEELAATTDARRAIELIREFDLPREAIPTKLLRSTEVWAALFERMPMTALIRNLATLTKRRVLTPYGEATRRTIEALSDGDRIRRARVHPIAIAIARAQYSAGRGLLGKAKWRPVPRITDALDEAFGLAFANVEPTGKRFLLAIDVSGSMSGSPAGASGLMASSAAAAMSLVTLRTEHTVTPMAFADSFRALDLTPKTSLAEAIARTEGLSFGATDCALPMLWATEMAIPVDVFVIYTDNETWFGEIHPAQALARYREKMGIAAKLVVMAMTPTEFTIADPSDPGMLDVVGFDASSPQALSEFALM